MKALIKVNIEPRVGMVVEALKGRYKHHIIGFDDRFLGWYDSNRKPKYGKHVNTINEHGSMAWIEYDHFINNYGFVTMSNYRLEDLFKSTEFDIGRISKVKDLMKQIEDCLK
ncbi:MAG: hypothetical protein IJ298_08855 [Ruminococcus sp.]|nr:hypothetical protein [Ruminococcus sp.]